MADTTIPNADAAILAAQAVSGQAGVEAYKAAQAALQQQKQQAVQQALQEAAGRGAPAGAMESITSTITGPYDQRLASLAQGQAAFQGDMASRDRRMADYNAAVNAARSYIPEQTAQLVAPINAEADMRVRMIGREGEMDVARIQQQLRLIEAQMAADAAKADRDASGKTAAEREKAMTPNVGELEGLLFGRARDRLSSSTQGLLDQIAANQASVNQSMAPVRRTLNDQYGTAAQRQSILQGQNNISAGYIAKGVAAAKANPPAAKPLQAATPGRGGITTRLKVTMPMAQAQLARQFQALGGGSRADTGPSALARAIAKIKTLNTGWMRPSAGGQASNQVSSTNPNLGRLAMSMGRSLGTNQAYYERPFRTTVPESGGRQVFLSQDQLLGLDPFDRDMILGAVRASGQPLLNEQDFNEDVMGVADEFGRTSSYSPEVVQNALTQAAEELLGEGYIFGEPELANVQRGPYAGKSIYDVLAEAAGQPSAGEEYTAAEKAAEAQRRAEEEAAETDETAFEEEEEFLTEEAELRDQAAQDEAAANIRSEWGPVPSSSFGTPVEIWDAISSPAYEAAILAIEAIVAENEDVEADEVDNALRSEGFQGIIRELALIGTGFKG